MPDPLSILRLAALLAFIGLVAFGLWLLDVAWWVVPPVMAGALLIAWTIEWLAWRGSVETLVVRETPVAPPPRPVVEPAPAPAEAIVPPAAPAPPQPEAPVRVQPKPPPPPPPPAPEPETVPVAAEPVPQDEPTRESRRARRLRLRAVPAPSPPADQAPPPQVPATPTVVPLQPRTLERRQWNLWDLERMAREETREHPERRDEWSFLFVYLRQFADADGSLPAEFDGLVRESFGGLLDAPNR